VHAIEHRDCRQVARSDPKEGHAHRYLRCRIESQATVVLVRTPEADVRWRKLMPPGMRPHPVPESRSVLARVEAVPARLLFIGPADGQVTVGRDLTMHDRIVAKDGSDDGVLLAGEDLDELLKPFTRKDASVHRTST
jgi:hypothetical protein